MSGNKFDATDAATPATPNSENSRRGFLKMTAGSAAMTALRAGHDRIYHWELGGGDDAVTIDVPGHLTLGNTEISIQMAVAGAGLFYCLRDRVAAQLEKGMLEVVLRKWTTPGPGFHAYYASHRQVPSALRAFLDHLKS